MGRRRYLDPRWSWWVVYFNDQPVGRPYWAVSEQQALRFYKESSGAGQLETVSSKLSAESFGRDKDKAEAVFGRLEQYQLFEQVPS